jgi:dTDP-4-amino-4,6-dideoxygalactose transaminase
VQLERYPGLLERRHQLAAMYGELLGDDEAGGMPLELPRHVGEGFRSSAHLYMLRLLGKGSEFRNELIRGLARRDVPANVHYKPLPLLSAYRALGFKPEDFPNALARYANEVTLPLHTLLTETDVAQAAEAFRESYEEAARLLG